MEKYEIIECVGEGSYGLVMKCRHRESGQLTAIKKFLETDDDATVRKMAIREIRMLKKLRHENLINLIEHFRRKKRFFLVFEYLEHTILEELEKNGSLDFSTSRKYIYQVLRALDFIHKNNVIHRDIKPENVLVSRLGVIKLCDFGFARPNGDDDTSKTEYVATRWYRSPELLVGDPHYGKEVDIWSVGCLYAEIMTGEPLFPGDSDIDQLFQIVRVLGKLNPRHQILINRNSIFKGMKQEQNSSLAQLFPDWNSDSLDFLTSCLKMDSTRPDTTTLLNDNLFLRDKFLDEFLPELKSKILQEYQGNPLLKRMAHRESGKKVNDGGKQEKVAIYQKPEEQKSINKGQIGLSLISNTYKINNEDSKAQNNVKNQKPNTMANANQLTNIEGHKFERIVSAKPSIPIFDEPYHLDTSSSPIHFQSLQTEVSNTNSDLENIPSSRNSPTYNNNNNNSVAGNLLQYFNSKRKTNDIVGERKVHKPSLVQLQIDRSNVNKRDRNMFLKVSTNSFPSIQPEVGKTSSSPRLLQPPSWLVGNQALNISQNKYAPGKASKPNKRGLTDWKSLGNKMSHDFPDFLLPNCSTAAPTISPFKGKKKLSPMIPEQSSQSTPLNHVN